MSLRSQLLKGILEGCILAIIHSETVYGYELSIRLQQYGLNDVSEGSIYPILLRLQKEGLIQGEMKVSPNGPKRKYYTMTDAGYDAYEIFQKEWSSIKKPVDKLIDRGNV
ncbi:PadR family transcriptional regulator [Thalassobacillus hwangdonensis]|uniref:PadR family transcriptional regulator n=1 Tax=Thalassobacillus hwangdonensis TaxID=546108 RepID=A0ABW3L3L9_9BACI